MKEKKKKRQKRKKENIEKQKELKWIGHNIPRRKGLNDYNIYVY